MIHVEVTADDIAAGIAGDCFACPVALALTRATGDDAANVYERECVMYIEVWARHITAPFAVRQFVWHFDDLPRLPSRRVHVTDQNEAPRPFTFELPDQAGGEWHEQCYHCGGLVDCSEVDDEGVCRECLAKEKGV